MAKDYSELSKEDLLSVIQKLESRKKYGLIWDEERTKEEFEKESEDALPVLKEIKGKEIISDPSAPSNILIEGDNYHALSVLNYTHRGKVDLIYIDPPYNTGNKTWKYNNCYIDRDDAYRHSKWLTFMQKRLRLAKQLLTDDGIIVVTIDDYEVFQLGMLMDEIFGENNRMATVVVLNKKSGRTTDQFFATCHEYYFFYAKNISHANIELFELDEDDIAEYKFEDEISRYKWRDFLRTGGFSTPKERPNSYYPIYYSEKTGTVSTKKISGGIEILPIDTKGEKRVWRQTIPSLTNLIAQGDIKIDKNRAGSYSVKIKDRIKTGLRPKTVWDNPRYDAATHGTKLLEIILGKAKGFDFPKSLYAVLDTLKITLKNKKDSVVLDFFAGSGTTGHAVLELNKEDGGHRKFILCTNNELNGLEDDLRNKGLSDKEMEEYGICQRVTYPRLCKVIKGFKDNANGVRKLPGNLKYFKTSFVKKSITGDNLKVRITRECTEMLCLRENIFNENTATEDYRIFEQSGQVLAIYYSMNRKGLKDLKKDLDKMTGKKILYCFTLDAFGLNRHDFDGWDDITLEPIPQKILDIYEGIYGY
ncbi:MAG: site-specific DNA-methyltransferase [Elusimicrobiales bacterium]